MPLLSNAKGWIAKILYKRITIILFFLFLAGITIAVTSMQNLSSSLIESQALQSAKISAQILKKARSLYSSEVINRIEKLSDIEVSHDYEYKQGAIPLPATFLIQLGHIISEKNFNASIRLYSKYPFPWREAEGGARDDFEREALQVLEQDPNEVFYRVENYKGFSTLRYAEPDIMKASCIGCHNSHPDSPKSDWKVGEVRGILEINQPLDTVILESRHSLSQTTLKLVLIGILALSGLILIIGRLKDFNKELDILVKLRTSELNQANNTLIQARQDITQLRIQVDRKKQKKEVEEIMNSHDLDSIAQLGKKWRSDNTN